jgi:hypothetical protein
MSRLECFDNQPLTMRKMRCPHLSSAYLLSERGVKEYLQRMLPEW